MATRRHGSSSVASVYGLRILRRSELIIHTVLCLGVYHLARAMLPFEASLGVFSMLFLVGFGVPRKGLLRVVKAMLYAGFKSC